MGYSMKSVKYAVLLAAAIVFTSMLNAQTTTYTRNPSLAIPDASSVGVTDTIGASGLTGSLSVLRVGIRIDHTYDGDLNVWLIPPGVTWTGPFVTPPAGVIELCTNVGSSGSNFGTGASAPYTYTNFTGTSDPVFTAAGSIASGTPPFANTYTPEGINDYDALYGTATTNGNWTLVVTDDAGGDTGTLLSWEIEIETGATFPEIDVNRTGTPVTPVADGGVDVVPTAYGTSSFTLSYSIENTGSGNLTLTTPVSAPGAQTNCTVTIVAQPTTTIAPSSATALDLSVTPTSAGPFSFSLSIGNDDANENPYDFTVQGAAVVPVSSVPFLDDFETATVINNRTEQTSGDFPTWNGSSIGSTNYAITGRFQYTGQTPPSPTSGTVHAILDSPANGPDAAVAIDYHFDLSSLNAVTDNVVVSFQWADAGDETDDEDGVFYSADSGVTWNLLFKLDPAANQDNVYNRQLVNWSQVLLGDSLNFNSQLVIRFQQQDNFSFTGGDGILFDDVEVFAAPEMDVFNQSSPVASGSTDSLGDVDFGISRSVIYTIENNGSMDLNLTGTPRVSITTGSNISQIGVTMQPTSTVTPAASTTFTVAFTTGVGGSWDFVVNILSDDLDESPYTWTVAGTSTYQGSSGGGGSDDEEGSCASLSSNDGGHPLVGILLLLALACKFRKRLEV
ncbi:MAG: hypothetical protein ACYTDT_04090 [Planctomycetota bacterium]|jgi:subtilisin-like proprotein convertase family protein